MGRHLIMNIDLHIRDTFRLEINSPFSTSKMILIYHSFLVFTTYTSINSQSESKIALQQQAFFSGVCGSPCPQGLLCRLLITCSKPTTLPCRIRLDSPRRNRGSIGCRCLASYYSVPCRGDRSSCFVPTVRCHSA